ncbi:uncharacterized protein N7484_003292 [Penicillium longicatenatum]|uniref:uncharacterized protein n=1 Tax=Penicillium longicatenatum TaxID=1561947 RepID=UPI002547A88C|nr:uncharacterized protein N7484_003292 [Penicillium longicatenatum]KAJ5649569.1 hypothetical protein N7484_003292 [Penicillium longicatenatum]
MSILARVVTGFGSSGMLDLSSVLLNDIGGPFGVAILRSYFMTVTMIGFSVGGALGGFLATLVGWRWSFLLHVPIVLLCALVTVCQLPKDAPQDPQSAVLDDNQERQEEKTPGAGNLDVLGIMFLVCAIVSALMMVQVLQGDIFPEKRLYISTGLGAASLLLAGVFCAHEVHWAKRPLIPLSFMMSSQTGIMGLILCIVSYAMIAIRWCFFNPSILELVYPFCCGVGLGILFSTQFVALSAHSPQAYTARLITTYYLMQQIGSVMGVSVTSWLIRSSFANGLENEFGVTPEGMRVSELCPQKPFHFMS